MSYSSDLSQSLSASLATLTPQLVSTPLPSASPSSTDLRAAATRPAASSDAIQDRTTQLRSILTKLHPTHAITPQALADLIDEAFPAFQGLESVPLSGQTENAELVTLAQLAITSYGTILKHLMEEASRLGEEDDWWSHVESDGWKTGVFLLQCESFDSLQRFITD